MRIHFTVEMKIANASGSHINRVQAEKELEYIIQHGLQNAEGLYELWGDGVSAQVISSTVKEA